MCVLLVLVARVCVRACVCACVSACVFLPLSRRPPPSLPPPPPLLPLPLPLPLTPTLTLNLLPPLSMCVCCVRVGEGGERGGLELQ